MPHQQQLRLNAYVVDPTAADQQSILGEDSSAGSLTEQLEKKRLLYDKLKKDFEGSFVDNISHEANVDFETFWKNSESSNNNLTKNLDLLQNGGKDRIVALLNMVNKKALSDLPSDIRKEIDKSPEGIESSKKLLPYKISSFVSIPLVLGGGLTLAIMGALLPPVGIIVAGIGVGLGIFLGIKALLGLKENAKINEHKKAIYDNLLRKKQQEITEKYNICNNFLNAIKDNDSLNAEYFDKIKLLITFIENNSGEKRYASSLKSQGTNPLTYLKKLLSEYEIEKKRCQDKFIKLQELNVDITLLSNCVALKDKQLKEQLNKQILPAALQNIKEITIDQISTEPITTAGDHYVIGSFIYNQGTKQSLDKTNLKGKDPLTRATFQPIPLSTAPHLQSIILGMSKLSSVLKLNESTDPGIDIINQNYKSIFANFIKLWMQGNSINFKQLSSELDDLKPSLATFKAKMNGIFKDIFNVNNIGELSSLKIDNKDVLKKGLEAQLPENHKKEVMDFVNSIRGSNELRDEVESLSSVEHAPSRRSSRM